MSDRAFATAKPSPVVVEVDEHLGPAAPFGDLAGPLVELGLRVVAAPSAVAVMEAHERPIGSELARLEGPAGVVCDDSAAP